MRSRSHAAVGVILNWVSRQNLPPGARLPSARLLAGQLGLGFTTAELACKVLISRGLLKRNGYKLLVGAGTPVHAPVSGEVCVLSYLESFSQIAGRFLSERGVKHRVVELNHVNQPNPAPVLRKVLSEKPAGVILWMPYWIEELESMLAPVKIPMVICSDPAPPNLHQSSVSGDIYRGTKKALQHLFDLGHRHIAHVSCSKTMPLDHELAACYRNVCGQLGLKQAAQAIWQAESAFNEVLRKTMLEQRKRHPEVTALYSHGFAASLARDIFRVPGDLSVVSFLEPVIKTRPPLTHVALRNPDCVPMWACTEIISQLQSLEAGHPKRPPNRAYFDLELIERGSTRVLSSREGFSDPILPIDPISPMGRTGSMGRMAATPWDSWRKTYLYLKKSASRNWRQLDLTKLANHSMTREHGWLGADPLLHFPPGLRSIHGVPFHVIEETLNGGRAVVTFRSPHTHSTEGKELPASAKLLLGGRVKALYFLHGCGWADKPVRFAEYQVHFQSGKAASIPLVPFGPSPSIALKLHGRLKPNLQDWYSLLEHPDFPHAKSVTVVNPADPEAYDRYLYTLEWINPQPKEEVTHIEVRVDPEAGPTLALIAVTALA